MDQDRQIRFAIPPFFMLASLLWGGYLGGLDLSPIFRPGTAKEVLGLLAAAAVAVVPMGFLISTLSVTFLRLLAYLSGNPTYEAVLSDATLKRIWMQLQSTQSSEKELTLYAAATFDHELLATGIHTWLLRRWNSFNVSAHSVVALLMAHAVAPILQIPQTFIWAISSFLIVGVLVFTAINAWWETMAMIEFQSYRQHTVNARKDGDT